MNWIPCSERIPDSKKTVLVTDGKEVAVAKYVTGCGPGWWNMPNMEVESHDIDFDNITHWLEIPPLVNCMEVQR